MYSKCCLLLCFLPLFSLSQKKYSYYDGPYISTSGDSIHTFWISDGQINEEYIPTTLPYHFDEEGLPNVELAQLTTEDEPFRRYTDVEKFIALSDIHGQHDLFIDLLQAHHVIDDAEHWSYGNGHLVIVGDILDRGDKVTESLWFLYQLEKEALQQNGKVHISLGNHELMVMHGDIGYIHPKYRYTSGISGQTYPSLFDENTVIGRWLRSKNISTIINDIGFVHGGYSMHVLKQEASLKKINEVFRGQLISNGPPTVEDEAFMHALYFENGPLWYRGYANPRGFDNATADTIMSLLDLEKIVVGHTSMPNVISTAQGRIILVDSSIKFGESGEVLIYENGTLSRGLLDGSQEEIHEIKDTQDITSPFQSIYANKDLELTVSVDTDLGALMGKLREKEEYVPASVTTSTQMNQIAEWDVRIRTRGNMRKKVCRIPPFKIDFSKEALVALGYGKNDKLKMVLPCTSSKKDQQALYREYHIYKMYEVVDPLFFRTRLTRMNLFDEGKEKYNFNGFFIEDEEEYESRTSARVVEKGVVTEHVLNRESYLKMLFFQYLILNTDWGIMNKHNVEILGVAGSKLPHVVPYDFDYSGMVNQSYAVPYETFPIKHIREPYFRGKNVTREEVGQMRDFYNDLRNPIEAAVSKSTLLDNRSKKTMLGDIERYYDVLNNERRWKGAFHLK